MCNYLFPVSVGLPVGDAVLLGDVLAVGDHLDVGHGLGPRLAALLHEQLGRQLGPVELLRHHAHAALRVGLHRAPGLQHISTHVLNKQNMH